MLKEVEDRVYERENAKELVEVDGVMWTVST